MNTRSLCEPMVPVSLSLKLEPIASVKARSAVAPGSASASLYRGFGMLTPQRPSEAGWFLLFCYLVADLSVQHNTA